MVFKIHREILTEEQRRKQKRRRERRGGNEGIVMNGEEMGEERKEKRT